MGDDLRSVFSDNLKKYMKEAGKTQADIMEYMGCSSSTVSDWCNGKKYPRPERMQRLADLFGIKMSDLTAQHSLPTDAYGIDLSRMSVIPILGKISAGLPIFADENIEGYTITDLNGGADYFALRVSGDSMNAARINDGDIIIVRKQNIVDPGEIAVVRVGDDEATVKRFFQTENTVTLVPQSYNQKHKPQIYDLETTNIDILGKVIKVEFWV